ncbi:MAG: hypothetical protein AB1454_08020 [Candidatus Auribacterota bacterium]
MRKNTVFIYILSLFILSISIHLPFLLTSDFGEQDAARIANTAIRSYYTGYLTKEYVMYSTPLYVSTLFILLKMNILAIKYIPLFMSLLTLIASAAATLCLFIFTYRITKSKNTALAGALLLQLNPAFWFNSIYGFPTIVSLSFFFLSLILFQEGILRQSVTSKIILFAVSLFLYMISVFTKIDAVLVTPLFCFPVWNTSSSYKTKILWCFALCIITCLCFLSFKMYVNSFPDVSLKFDISEWSDQFPLDFGYFCSAENRTVIARAMGFLSIPLAFIGFFFIPKQYKVLYCWVVLSMLPIVFFWGLRTGNTARHNLFPAVLIYILLILPLLNKRVWKLWLLALLIMSVVNYIRYPATANTARPSGRLIRGSQWLKDGVTKLRDRAEHTLNLPFQKIAVIGQGWQHPFYIYQLFLRYTFSPDSFAPYHHFEYTIMDNDNLQKTFCFLYSESCGTDKIIGLHNKGYSLLIKDKDLRNDLQSAYNVEFDNEFDNEILDATALIEALSIGTAPQDNTKED